MKREQRYGIKSLAKDFPTEESVLDFIFDARNILMALCSYVTIGTATRNAFGCYSPLY